MTSPPSSSISPLDQQQHQHNSYSEHLTSINGKNSLQGAGKVQKIENTNSSDFMTIQQASISIFKFLNYFLPFALLAMISSQVGKVGLSIFQIMFEFIGQQILGGVVVIILATIVLWLRSKINILQVINEVKQTIDSS